MKLLSISILIMSFILFGGVFVNANPSVSDQEIARYFDAISKGDFQIAFDQCAALAESDDSDIVEFALHLAEFTAKYPDMVPTAIKRLEALETPINKKDDRIKYAYKTVMMNFYSRAGRLQDVERERRDLGYVTSMKIIGPFAERSGVPFDKIDIAPAEKGGEYNCRGVLSGWYGIEADRKGVFRFDAFYDRCSDSVFIAEIAINVAKAGSYRIELGRAGRLAAEIDGSKIFSDSEETRFYPGQQALEGYLKAGAHRLRLYIAGNTHGESALSVQCRPVKGSQNAGKWSLVPGRESDNSFISGFLRYKKGLFGVKNHVREAMDKIPSVSPLYARGRFFSALAENDPNQGWKLIEEAARISSDPVIMLEQGDRAIDAGMIGEADRISMILDSMNTRSVSAMILAVDRSFASSWYEQVPVLSDRLRKAGFPIVADLVALHGWGYLGIPQKKLEILERLFDEGMEGENVFSEVVSNVSRGLRSTRWKDLLTRSSARDGYGVLKDIVQAEMLCDEGRSAEALPLVSSLLKRAPCNGNVLYLAGRTYLLIGKKDIAHHYFNQALLSEPQNKRFILARLSIKASGKETGEDINWGAAAKQGAAFGKEAAVCLRNDVWIEVGADGSYSKRVRAAYRVNRRENAEFLRKRSVVIDEASESLDEINYTAIRSGRIRKGENVTSSSLSDPESGLYYDYVDIQISAPNIENGDILVFEYRIRSNGGPVKGYYGDRLGLDPECRTLKTRVVINSRMRGLRWKSNNCQLRSSESGGNGVRTIILEGADFQAVIDEPMMLPLSEILPSIDLSSFGSLDDFHRWYLPPLREREGLSDRIRKEIDRICSSAKNEREKVSAIYGYVTGKIRYTGFENGLGGFMPRKADETFASSSGDCKDIAFLLAQSLRYAGIKADLALVLTRDAGVVDRKFISLNAFNHALCRVMLEKPLYLDGTVKNHGIDDLPLDDRDVDALVISDSGSFLERIDGSQYSKKMETIRTEITLGDDMSAVIDRVVKKEGPGARSLSDEDRGVKEEDIQSFWNERYPGAQLSGFSMEHGAGSVQTDYRVIVNEYSSKSDTEITVPAHIISSDIANVARRPSRSSSLFISENQTIRSVSVYHLPKGFVVTQLPTPLQSSYRGMKYHSEYLDDGSGVITVSVTIEIPRMIIKSSEYDAFKRMLRDIARDEKGRIVAERITR